MAIAASGIHAGMQKLQSAAAGVASAAVAAGIEPKVDGLAGQLVAGLEARSDIQANVQVLARSDQMIGSLLDVLA